MLEVYDNTYFPKSELQRNDSDPCYCMFNPFKACFCRHLRCLRFNATISGLFLQALRMFFQAVDAFVSDERVRGGAVPASSMASVETIAVNALQKHESSGVRTELLSAWYHDDDLLLREARTQGSTVCSAGPDCARCRSSGPGALGSATDYAGTDSDDEVLPVTTSSTAEGCVICRRGW